MNVSITMKIGLLITRSPFSLGYKDSNLEMTESESVALPFGDSPISYLQSQLSKFSIRFV